MDLIEQFVHFLSSFFGQRKRSNVLCLKSTYHQSNNLKADAPRKSLAQEQNKRACRGLISTLFFYNESYAEKLL